MKLTDSQKRRINTYMREVGAYLDDLDEDRRRDALIQLRRRLEQELARYGDVPVADSDVEAVLDTCGPPSVQAALLAGTTPSEAGETRLHADGLWLGVCAMLAHRFDLPPYALRLVAVLIGIAPPLLPVVLLAYVAVYFALRHSELHDETPPIDWFPLLKELALPFFALLALHAVSRGFMELIRRLVWRFFEEEVLISGRWGWLEIRGTGIFLWLLFCLLPLTVIYTITPTRTWQATLKKVSHASIAVYALMLCFGLASYLVGVILQFIDVFGEMGSLPSLL